MLPKILIIEGTDGTGKSTLAGELSRMYSTVNQHAAQPTYDNWYDEYVAPVDRIVASSGTHIVLDRWHIGEYIWPSIFDRKSLFKRRVDFVACHGLLVRRGAVVYIMTRDPEEIEAELRGRGETDQQIEAALDGYYFFLEVAAMGLPNVMMGSLPTARVAFGLDRLEGVTI